MSDDLTMLLAFNAGDTVFMNWFMGVEFACIENKKLTNIINIKLVRFFKITPF